LHKTIIAISLNPANPQISSRPTAYIRNPIQFLNFQREVSNLIISFGHEKLLLLASHWPVPVEKETCAQQSVFNDGI